MTLGRQRPSRHAGQLEAFREKTRLEATREFCRLAPHPAHVPLC
jgi:hypothetical protein